MKPSLAPTGSPVALIFCAFLVAFSQTARVAIAAPASPSAAFWYAGTQLTFDHPQLRDGALAVALDDGGLLRFLRKLNATVAYQSGQSYIVVTGGDRRTISFALGDPSVTVDGTPQAAAFGAYGSRSSVYVPFVDLARALGIVPIKDGDQTVLQPQIGSIDVKTEKSVTYVTVHGASTLRFKRVDDVAGSDLSVAFLGTASLLDRDRQVTSPGLRALTLNVQGTPRNPSTVVDFAGVAGGTHVLVSTSSPNTVEFAFAAAGVALEGSPVPATSAPLAVIVPPIAGPMPAPPSSGTSTTATPTALSLTPATITALTTDASATGFNVNLAITGPVTYEWHRLADFRWYIDLKPASLAIAPQDTPLDDPAIVGLRLKPFVGPNDKLPSVRLGVTLPSARAVSLVATQAGLTISIGTADDPSPAIGGTGELNGGQLLADVPLPPPPPEAVPWKFGSASSGPNSRLIVIDPGHGGSDAGAVHNGMNEKDLTLDLSRRLRTALIARGWQVKMTRESDVDVYAPNDSAHDELQARDDIANSAGARLLISVHVNAFTTSDLNGTTTYYYKADSSEFAQAVHARLVATLPTQDDGVRKANFYVIRHTNMPSILVETAFVSNSGDAALLRTDVFKNEVAQAIAAGVGDYTKSGGASSDAQ